MMKWGICLLALLLLTACGGKKRKNQEIVHTGKNEGVIKTYDEEGFLTSEDSFKGDRKHGICKKYYRGGKLMSVTAFRDGRRHGTERTYFRSGELFRITCYKENMMDSIRTFYWKNGNVKAMIPYRSNKPGKGLREFRENGTEMKKYPEIVIRPEDDLFLNGNYKLWLSLSNKSKNVEFYKGELVDGQYLGNNLMKLGAGEPFINYNLGKGGFVMEVVHVVACYTTTTGFPYVTEKTYNLAIENPGL